MKTSDTIGGLGQQVEEADIRDITGEAVIAHEQAGGWSRTGKLAVLVSLIAITATGGGLVFGYLHWSRLEASLEGLNNAILETNQRTLDLGVELTTAKKSFDLQSAGLDLQMQALERQEQQLKEERDRLMREGSDIRNALQTMSSRIGSSSSDWMVSEAEYLLTVANYRLSLERDAATALLALQAADERLMNTGNPEWNQVRDRLRLEIERLSGVQNPDRGALSARIVGLAEQVSQLRIRGPRPAGEALQAERPVATSAEGRSFKTLLRDGWEGFKSIMVIRQHGQPLSAVLPPEQQFFIYQNIRLQLAAAQLSLIYENQALYDSSLKMVSQWLDGYFDQEDASSRSFGDEITQLRGIRVTADLPDLSASLAALRERLLQFRQGRGGG